MANPVSTFITDCLLSGVLVAGAWILLDRLGPQAARQSNSRWFAVWAAKGLVVPLLIWAIMNAGLAWWLQPFMPEVQIARNKGGPWLAVFLAVLARGGLVVSADWAAVVLAWGLMLAAQPLKPEARAELKTLCWTYSLGLGIPVLLVLWVGGLKKLGLAGLILLAPIAGYAPNVLRPPKRSPMYARAIAKLKFGKYAEAEWEIIRELEKFEDDFDGWLMMADLYANQFRDLPEAEQTILEICSQPTVTSSQVAVALHRLADWHLKLARDPEGARRALQAVCDRFPGSHLARMARLRMNQLPATADELRDQQTAEVVPLPALGDQFDQTQALPESSSDRHKAALLANNCVERLKKNPDYVPAREKLARLCAEHLDKVEFGLEQLALLLEMPNQPEARRVEWLSLTAAWHLKYTGNIETGRRVLEQLVRDFPRTPQALAARRRLDLMERERKALTRPSPRPLPGAKSV